MTRADRDIVSLGIAFAAMILFVGTGGSIVSQTLRHWMGHAPSPPDLLVCAMLLNIALMIFGWRRYRELQEEMAERREAEEKARWLAETDPLTGCLNRRSGEPALARLAEAARGSGRHLAVIMLDMDNFKQINDLNGHQAGDHVLRAVAERLRETVPPGSVLIRMGGDEFVCGVIQNRCDTDLVEKLAERIIAAVSQPIDENGLLVQPAASIGLASTCQDRDGDGAVDAARLIHRADIAMYHAKKCGRNRLYWFDPLLEDELRLRSDLEAAIRRGITAGEFVPFYEQQVDVETGELTGFEMLARWQSPRYGLVGPEVFIPIAEEIGVIGDLSESLIRRALKDAREWDPRLTLSVNISPLQLRDAWFAQKLLQMLVESGFPPSRLEIEITESCLHENIGAVRAIVTSLKNQGIRVCLDDFGTGYSSLSQLRSLPFDRLKIDRSFVADLSQKGNASELITAILSLGRGLELPVTAEGIENEKVLESLRGLGKMKGQGYFYGRPEDADTTRQRLAGLGLLLADAEHDAAPAEGAARQFEEDHPAAHRQTG